jgi:hypothetical protein
MCLLAINGSVCYRIARPFQTAKLVAHPLVLLAESVIPFQQIRPHVLATYALRPTASIAVPTQLV